MGKIVFYLGEISGRVGGLVFSKNKGGNYLKPFTRQNNPRTPDQSIERASFQAVTSKWNTISEANRASWRTQSVGVYDQFGNLRTLSGRELFISLNRNLYLLNLTLLDAPPANYTAVPMPTNVIQIDNSVANNGTVPESFYFRLESGNYTVADAYYILRCTKPLRNTIMNPGHQLTYVFSAGVTAPGHYDFSVEYATKYGVWDKLVYADEFSVHYSLQLLNGLNGVITAPVVVKNAYGYISFIWIP